MNYCIIESRVQPDSRLKRVSGTDKDFFFFFKPSAGSNQFFLLTRMCCIHCCKTCSVYSLFVIVIKTIDLKLNADAVM